MEYRRYGYILLALLVIASGFLHGCRQHLTPVEKWRAKILAAHGGRDTLARVATIVFSGRIVTKGDSGTVTLVLSRPRKLRATMKFRKRFEDRILLGNRGWRNFGDGFEEVSAQSLAAMVFQYNHLDLPMGLIGDKYKISYAEQKINGRILPVLKLAGDNGPAMTVTADPETGLIQRVEGRIQAGPREIVMGVGYSDYRAVAGVMLPHRIVNYVNGTAIAESRYDTVVVNADLDPHSFDIDPRPTGK